MGKMHPQPWSITEVGEALIARDKNGKFVDAMYGPKTAREVCDFFAKCFPDGQAHSLTYRQASV